MNNSKKLVVVLSGGGLSYAQKVASYSPLVWWKMNETSGTTIVNSGTGGATYNGTLSLGGGALGAEGIGDGGTSIQFDGTATTISIPSFPSPPAAVMDTGTLLFWWKLSTAQWNDGVLRSARIDRTTGPNYVYIQKTNANLLRMYRAGGGISGTDHSMTPNKSGVWSLVALTWNVSQNRSSAYQILKGGTVAASSTGTSGGAWASGTALWQTGYAGAYMTGYVAHFTLLPVELSQSQLQDLAA